MKNRMILLCASVLCSMAGITLNAMEKPKSAAAPVTPTNASEIVGAMTSEQRQELIQTGVARRLAQKAEQGSKLVEAAKPAEERADVEEAAVILERDLRSEKTEILLLALKTGLKAGLVPLAGMRHLLDIYSKAKDVGCVTAELHIAMAAGAIMQLVIWLVPFHVYYKLSYNIPVTVISTLITEHLLFLGLRHYYAQPIAPARANGPLLAAPLEQVRVSSNAERETKASEEDRIKRSWASTQEID